MSLIHDGIVFLTRYYYVIYYLNLFDSDELALVASNTGRKHDESWLYLQLTESNNNYEAWPDLNRLVNIYGSAA